MSNPFKFYDKAHKYFGRKYGNSFSISSIDYTASDQAPTIVDYDKYYVETVTDAYAMTQADAEFYRVDGLRLGKLQPGYLLRCTKSTYSADTTPDLTVVSYKGLGTTLAIKTTRIGAIYNGPVLLYDNIRYDYLPRTNFPGAPLNREIEASTGVPTVQVTMFNRDLWTNTQDAEGLYLYQTDSSPNLVWLITDVTELKIDGTATILMMTLKRATQ